MRCFTLTALIFTFFFSRAAPAHVSSPSHSKAASWAGWGNGIFNNRWTKSKTINASNVRTLALKCSVTYPFGVSATPVVLGTAVYYPTWNGSFVSLDYTTCKVHWTLNVTKIIYDFKAPTPDVALATFPLSRTSPQIDGDVLFFGTQMHALLVAINRHTGRLLGLRQINSHPYAVITMSPTLYNHTIFIGTASLEEPSELFFPAYQCCTFIGNIAALIFSLKTSTFTTKWDLPTLPSPPSPSSNSSSPLQSLSPRQSDKTPSISTWWSGAAIWGSQPSISPDHSLVYFATGNVYSFPPSHAHCALPNQTADCLPPDILQNTILAVDITTGTLRWAKRTSPMDAFNGACITNPIVTAGCPATPPGPDADFGMAPVYVPRAQTAGLGVGRDLVVVGQKNTVIYALDAVTGETYWVRILRPAMRELFQGGGIRWGLGVDETALYYTMPFSRPDLPVNVSTALWGAVGLKDGKVLWETAAQTEMGRNSISLNPGTVAGDLVFVPRTGDVDGEGSYIGSQGGLVVLERGTGEVIVEREVDVMFQGGIAVVGGFVMFGTGYRNGVIYDYRGNGTFQVWVVDAGEKC